MAAESDSLEKRCKGNDLLLPHFWPMYCVSAIAEHEWLDSRIQVGSLALPSALAEGMSYGI